MAQSRKQQKKVQQTTASHWWLFTILGAIGFVVGVSYVNSHKRENVNTTTASSAPATPVSKQADGYQVMFEAARAHANIPDRFWIKGGGPVENDIQPMQDHQKRISAALERFRGVSSKTQEIYALFGKFRATKFIGGYTQDIVVGGNQADMLQMLEHSKDMIEIAVVTERDFARLRFPSFIYYRADWGAVMAAAVEMPETLLGAFMYHELGHAKKDHVDHAPSAHAPGGSDLWVGEEAEMHEIEYDILNEASHGELRALYEAIIARARSKDADDVISSIVPADLDRYESIFDLRTVGGQVYGLCLSQFVLGLGIVAVNDATTDEAERLRRKIELYRLVVRRMS